MSRQAFAGFWLAIALLLSSAAQAQLRISGEVRDAQTQQPLPFASVFLVNTTYGTTTDSTGHFVLPNVKPGNYELGVSYLGYQLFKKTLVLQESITLTPNLIPAASKLDEVVVHPENRRADYRRFTKQFIGTSGFSLQCRIENPQEVWVVYDEKKQELTAVAPRGLRVINPLLGYRITYHQFDFKVNYHEGTVTVLSVPVFEEMRPASAKQQQQWILNRQKVYAGSLQHFLRSVRENRVAEEGFAVRAMVCEPNSPAAQNRLKHAADSLAEATLSADRVLTRVYKEPLSAPQIRRVNAVDSSNVQLWFNNALQVIYTAEQPDPLYVEQVKIAQRNGKMDALASRFRGGNTQTTVARTDYTPVYETSELRLLGPVAVIQPNGYVADPRSLKVDGYWSFERVGETLPLDYVPTLLK